MAIEYIGVGGVAKWFNVSAPAVCGWRNNYDNTPEPDAYLAGTPGWLPHREEDWLKWYRLYGPRPHRRKKRDRPV